MSELNHNAVGLEPPPAPSGFLDRLRWAYRSLYRQLRPLTEDELRERVDSWKRKVGVEEPGGELYKRSLARPNRCCVIRLPGNEVRCSTRPTSDADCRLLARELDPSATARFYPDRPCVGCQSLP